MNWDRAKSILLTVIFTLALLHLLLLKLQSRRQPEHSAGEFDRTFQEVAGESNLALHFDGFEKTDVVPSALYFRSIYVLYPRRVFVGGEDRIIHDTPQLLAAQMPPHASWLHSRGVARMLWFKRDLDGQISISTTATPGS